MAHQNSSLLIRPRSRVKNQRRMASLPNTLQWLFDRQSHSYDFPGVPRAKCAMTL